MGKAKKKFIDKKNAVTFRMTSQQDPRSLKSSIPQNAPDNEAQSSISIDKFTDPEERQKEQQKYGIFYNDDYDYLQHLKDISVLPVQWERVENPNDTKSAESSTPNPELESAVYAFTVKDNIPLVDKTPSVLEPELELDVDDTLIALEENFDQDDPDHQIDDEFFKMLNAGGDEDIQEEDEDTDSEISSGRMVISDDEGNEVCSFNGSQFSYNGESTNPNFVQEHFTSQKVTKRNAQLSLLDDKFEKIWAEYDDTEIGALDCHDIEGHEDPNSERLWQCVEAQERKSIQDEEASSVAELMKTRLSILERYSAGSYFEDKEKIVLTAEDEDDCMSFLSNTSNIYNHPKVLPEPKSFGKIKINPRTGIPKYVLDAPAGKLTEERLAQLDRQYNVNQSRPTESVASSMKSRLSVLSIRPKNETPEERNVRKHELKEYRKERRIERKANTEAFKEEKKRQEKILLNNRMNHQGKRLA